VRYAFIEGQRALHCVRRMCDNLQVSPAGYYEWRSRSASARSVFDAELTATIVDAHQKSHRRYGRPRIHADLRDLGFRVGAKHVARLMKAARIEGIRPRRFKKPRILRIRFRPRRTFYSGTSTLRRSAHRTACGPATLRILRRVRAGCMSLSRSPGHIHRAGEDPATRCTRNAFYRCP